MASLVTLTDGYVQRHDLTLVEYRDASSGAGHHSILRRQATMPVNKAHDDAGKGRPEGPFKGRVAVVTGAGRGIGLAIARKLGSAGAQVVVNDLSSVADAAAAELRESGTGAVAFVGDITRDGVPEQLVEAAIDSFGSLDIIVNNAGYATYAPVLEMTDGQWAPMLDLLLTAPFRILRAAGPHLVKPAEHLRKVVNVSSVGGISGSPNSAGYAAAKAGLLGLTRTLAKEWGPYGVTVNAVAPGLVRTRLTEGPAGGHDHIDIAGERLPLIGAPLTELESMVPLRRIGTPEDIAGAVYMLCLSEADYVSGETLVVGGGWMP
ncbi:SDR family NAD(P)-dependent oxidoreductase [Streptomyces spiralis]|uniref:SDR family NAD(P)-dependent oxidoreductase n=1 Tax=Streptomyces spiralis TaxID=66376 RepID=UPI0033C6A10D